MSTYRPGDLLLFRAPKVVRTEIVQVVHVEPGPNFSARIGITGRAYLVQAMRNSLAWWTGESSLAPLQLSERARKLLCALCFTKVSNLKEATAAARVNTDG